jgi:fibronectin type 3 domain-containing protein
MPRTPNRSLLIMTQALTTFTTRLLAALVVLAICLHSAVAAVPQTHPSLTVTGPLETQLTLSWTAVSGATSYNVYRGTSSGSETLLKSGVGATTYEDSGLGYGLTLYYQVTAVNSSGEGSRSNEPFATTQAIPTVTFTATPGDSQVVLNWSASPTATSYKIYRDTLGAPSGATSFIVNLANTTTVVVNGQSLLSYTDTGLVNGTPCFYEIAPINSSGENTIQTGDRISATPTASSGSEAPTGAPVSLRATAGTGQVLLKWLPVSNATTYDVFRSTSAGTEAAWHSGVAGLSYTDSNLANGTTYYYKVRATSSGGSSSLSSEASATPNVPGTPMGLTATTASGDVMLTWSAVGTSYAIYRGVTPGAETLLDSGLTGNAYTDAGLVNGTTYYYKVEGLNAGGTGPLSAEISATPTGPAAQSWSGTINFGLPGEPVQSCQATIPDINRPVLFAFFVNTQGPNIPALITKYNAIELNFEGTTAYNFGTGNTVNLGTGDDSSAVCILDYRWPQLGARRILAALAAAAAAVPSHPEIANTGIVIHGFSVGTDNVGTTLAQVVGTTSLVSRVLAVIGQSEIDEDRYNPDSLLDTVPYLLQATGVGGDASSQLNVGAGDFPSVNIDVFVRGLATNQGAPLTVFDNVGQGHGGAPDHPFIPIWLDGVLRQRLPATLPTSSPVSLPSWQNSSAWGGAYNVTTSTSSPWGSSGNPGVEMVSNVVSALNAYTDPRPFTWLPSQSLAGAWLSYANNGTTSSLAPSITSVTTVKTPPNLPFVYAITASNNPTSYGALGLPSWLSLNASTGVLSGTPPSAGNYTVTVSATNGNGTGSAILTINVATVTTAKTFAQWAATYGLAANTSLTTEGDGVPILLKYLCDINPNVPMSAQDRDKLPVQGSNSTTTPGTLYLTLTFNQSSTVTGISTHLQTSPDLKNWSTVKPDLTQQTPANGDVTVVYGMKVGGANQFLRLNVTQP